MAARSGYDVFLAAPMSAYSNDREYREGRDEVLALIEALKAKFGFREVYFAGQDVASVERFSSNDAALAQDMAALRASRAFCLLYPARLASSVLVEVGYAMALGIPCVLLTRRRGDLPFLLIDAEKRAIEGIPPIRIVEYGDRDPASELNRHPDLFRF